MGPVSPRARSVLVLALLALLAASGRADIFPPHQFRLTDPSGSVEIETAAGQSRNVDARALLEKGDTVRIGKDSSATIRIAQIGNLYAQTGTVLQVAEVEADGRPVFLLDAGQVLLKTRPIGAEKPLEVRFGPENRILVTDGMIELRYNPKAHVAALAPLKGKAMVGAKDKEFELPDNLILVRDDGARAKKPLDKGEVRDRWQPIGPSVLDPDEIEKLQDEVAPVVQILEPADLVTVDQSSLSLRGTVDDPTIETVRINVNSQYRKYAQVNGGEFRADLVLRDEAQDIEIFAVDKAKNEGSAKVRVRCRVPAPPLVAPVAAVEDSGLVTRIKKAIKDPKKDPEAIAMIAAGGFALFLFGIFAIRFMLKNLKKGAETAAGLATGVIFNRCEACGERQYEYHLFYTTEPVTSPFMRNLINNVNPMATSIMNESLENLLNTGLQGSAGSKGADQKIRVTCTWCDICKVGNLKLEHMKDNDVFKTDDYQIIHPIFIEWVRKVYD